MKRLIVLIPLLLCGCNTMRVTDPVSGFEFRRQSNALAKTGFTGATVTIGPDGTRIITLSGYAQESADTWSAIVKAAVEAGVAAGKASQGVP